MDKKVNEINHLASKSRILAALSGKGYRELAERDRKSPAEAFDADDEAYPAAPATDDSSPEEPKPAGGPLARPLRDGAGRLDVVHLLPPVRTEDEAIDASLVGRQVFEAFLASRISPRTRETMYYGLQRVSRLLGAEGPELVPWHTLRFEHTDTVRARLLDGSYSRATVLLTLESLKGVLRQAKRMELITRDQYDRITDWDRLKGDALPAGRELSQEEIDAIKRYIESQTGAYGAFLEAVFALLLGTGLRAIEACRASLEAYDDRGYIRVLRKGDKPDELPLGGAELAALNTWREERKCFEKRIESPALLLRVQRNDWVRPRFPDCTEKYLNRVCANVAKGAGLENVFTPHDLRRTFCTRALRISNDTLMVQELMGHSNTNTTRKYDRRALEERATKRRGWNIWRPPPAPVERVSAEVPEQLRGWIESGDIRIEEVDLEQFTTSPRLRTYTAGSRTSDGGNASPEHQRLCALSALYLESIERPFTFERGRCWYAGGIADVCALDGSLFVECGDVPWMSKPLAALCAGQTLMVVPYGAKAIGFIVRSLTDAPRQWQRDQLIDLVRGKTEAEWQKPPAND